MELHKQNILFILRAVQHGGTEKVVIQLCNILGPKVNKLVICSAEGFQTQPLDDLKVKHYVIPDIEKRTFGTMLRVGMILTRVVREEKITIIHTHHRMAAFYARSLSVGRKLLLINTAHNTFYDKKLITRLIYHKMNLVACGEKVKNNLVNYFGINPQKITVIHNAVEEFDGYVRPDQIIQNMKKDGYFIIGNIGRLSKQKGMDFFIRAVPKIIEKYPQTRFLIIGAGEEEENLRKLSVDLRVDVYILFIGYRTDIQNIMSQIDLVVLSSLWEGLPLTPIEAFSVGKTIVATAVDGTVEIVEDLKNGLLVDAKNEEQLADKIVWMIEHPEEKKNMEREAFIRYQKEFSFSQLSQLYTEYYESL